MIKLKKFTLVLFIALLCPIIFSSSAFAQIVLQPDGAAGKDAWLDSDTGTPDGDYNRGNDPDLVANNPGPEGGVIQFVLPALPLGNTVTSATLEVLEHNGCDSNVNTLEVHTNSAAWDEATVTWNNAPTYGSSFVNQTGEPGGNTCEWLIFDVTTFVQNWYGGAPHYGFRITGPGSSGNVYKFIYSSDRATASERPILRINYSASQLSIPTMTQWGMIVFLVLAGLGAVYYMRRQTRKSN